MSDIMLRPPTYALQVFEDGDRYKCAYTVASETSNRVYKISFDMGAEWWCCSCRGCISHGQCKHLTSAGLRGRLYGKNPAQVRAFLAGDGRRAVGVLPLKEIEKKLGKEKKVLELPATPEMVAMVASILKLAPVAPVEQVFDDGPLEG